MKVCILSMQDVQNFGSLMQGYSLKKILEELGHEVSFISIEPNEADNLLMGGFSENYSIETGYGGFLNKIKRIDKYALNRLNIKKRNKMQNTEFVNFRKEYLQIDMKNQEQQYDVCVIGSDEVFNCNVGSKWGFTSQLFGNVRQAEKVITYAACCGSTEIANVPELVQERIREAFREVSAFSVRDENTGEFVRKLSGKEPEFHLDPVLVGKFDDEMESVEIPQGLPEHFCIIYSYYNRINDEQEIALIKEFCKRHHLEIISLGAPQMWIKNHVVCTPFQMLKVFQKADFVITDTFHGTIFSVKYAQRFVVKVKQSNANKLLDLLCRLKIEEHRIDTFDNLEKAYVVQKKQQDINRIIETERSHSIEYLKENII